MIAPRAMTLTDEPRYQRLSIHDAVVTEAFCPFAAELRAELLHYPRWKTMRLGSGAYDSFQTAITTGHIQGRFPELEQCHRFARLLLEHGPRLCTEAHADPAPPIGVDMTGMAYGEGGLLQPHTDGIATRKLAFILYLTPPGDDGDDEWSEAAGGELVLLDRDGGSCAIVRPRFNRLAAFRVSDESWHEIRIVRRQTTWETCRLTLSGWLDGNTYPGQSVDASPA